MPGESGQSLKRVFKMQKSLFQVASALQSKVMAKPGKGNVVPCIMPCKLVGSENLRKVGCLSITPFLTFVYISNGNTKLPGIFGCSKKSFYEPV